MKYTSILIVLLAALVTTAFVASQGAHHGSPALLTNNTQAATQTAEQQPDSTPINCSLEPSSDTQSVSTATISGRCNGVFTSPFQCKTSLDDLYVTANTKNASGTEMYLQINVEKFTGPGDYEGTEANLITVSQTQYPRWQGVFPVHVSTDNSVTLPKTDLAPIPGTGADGTVSLQGLAFCGK